MGNAQIANASASQPGARSHWQFGQSVSHWQFGQSTDWRSALAVWAVWAMPKQIAQIANDLTRRGRAKMRGAWVIGHLGTLGSAPKVAARTRRTWAAAPIIGLYKFFVFI
jgi:hypothetical protein